MEYPGRGITLHLSLPSTAQRTRQDNEKYMRRSSCTYKVYKGKIIMGPDGSTTP